MGVGEFVGGVDHVNITNGSATCDIDQNVSSFLEIQLFAPSLTFQNMGGFLHWGNPDPADPDPVDLLPTPVDLAPYGFPNNTDAWPDCVANFLNYNLHPTADYEHIILKFSTCGCGSANLMDMKEGDILPVRMSFLFFSHIWGCPPNSPFNQKTFLNLMMSAHGYDRGGTKDSYGSTFDIYIKRLPDNVWIASVDTKFDNPDPAYQNLPDSKSTNWAVASSDNIRGQYATCESSKGPKGKTTWTTTYHYPWAKAPLKFQIKFWQY